METDKPTIEVSKFIIHPNYKMKVNRDHVKLVNFITATRGCLVPFQL